MSNGENERLASARVPGVLYRLSAAAARVAVGLVVVSAVLELGTTHWGLALVALPLLVANAVVARLAYPQLFAGAVGRGRAVPRRDRTRRCRRLERRSAWASVLHVGAAGAALGASLLLVAAALRGTPLALARATT